MGRSWCRGTTGDLVRVLPTIFFNPASSSLSSFPMHVSSSPLFLFSVLFQQHSVFSAFRGGRLGQPGMGLGLVVVYRMGSLAAGFSEKGVLSR